MKMPLRLTALAALALLIVSADAAPRKKAPAGPEFGEAVAGLSVAVEVLPGDWHPNARVEFACTVKNTTQAPIRTAAWGLDLIEAIEIRSADGKVIVPESERTGGARMPRGAIVTLAPGASQRFVLKGLITREKALVVTELFGGTWTWPLREGSLGVRAVFTRSAHDSWAAPLVSSGYWTGTARSAESRVVMSGVALEPGEPVNGLRLKLNAENTDLRMTPDGLGGWNVETAKVEIGFVNEGADALEVNARDLITGLVRFEIDGPDEASVRITRVAGAPDGADRTDAALLEPNTGWTPQAPITLPGILGGLRYELLKPGQYRVAAVYASDRDGFWRGLVQSNVLTFNVVGGPTPAGTAVKGLKLTLSTDTPEILIDGGPAKLTLAFANTGDAPIKLDAYDFPFRNLRLDITGPDGRPGFPKLLRMSRNPLEPAEDDYPLIQPGKSWAMGVKPRFPGAFDGTDFSINQPGEYKLKVTYENAPVPTEGEVNLFSKGAWTGVVTSNELVVNVIPALKKR